MPFGPAPRGQIDPFIVMEVVARANRLAAEGRDILHLEIGQPTGPAPAAARNAARNAIEGQALGYTESLGRPELRRAIAAQYGQAYGLDLPAARVVATTGSSAGFQLAFLAAFSPGQRVALADPGYPAYRNILKALGLVPVPIPTTAETRFQPTPAQLDALEPQPDGLIVASPSNPTGTMLGPGELAALTERCAERGIRLISDEIYHGLTYGSAEATAAAYSNSAVVVNSFSKYYAMTGWRIGWLVVPEDLARAVECLAQNLFISPPAVSQHAAQAALGARDELEHHRQGYERNRDRLLDGLAKAGFGALAPADGAFYVYADVSGLTDDSLGFCTALLEEAGVATTPGIDFDPQRGHRFVRFSFAGDSATMAGASERLQAWLGG